MTNSLFRVGDRVKFCGHCTNPDYKPAQPGAVGVVRQLSTRNYHGKSVDFVRVEYGNHRYALSVKNWRILPESPQVPVQEPSAEWATIFANLERWNIEHGRVLDPAQGRRAAR